MTFNNIQCTSRENGLRCEREKTPDTELSLPQVLCVTQSGGKAKFLPGPW